MILRASANTVRTKRLAEEEIENLNQSLAILYHFERHKLTYMGGIYDARSYNLLSEMKDIFDNSFITLARRHREGLFTKMYIKSREEQCNPQIPVEQYLMEEDDEAVEIKSPVKKTGKSMPVTPASKKSLTPYVLPRYT